jgi:2-oxoisovalerate dehydrogenase E1 component
MLERTAVLSALPYPAADILADYRIAYRSRQASLIGRREVLTGKAKFGIFGDGKEVAQLAMAKAFRRGDFRSGYYRDQTFMFATGALDVRQWFAQLYADPDVLREPASAGRQMNGHYATRSLDEHGNWRNLTEQINSAADISPTASQMPRLLGLAQASKLYRALPALKAFTDFSYNGNEIAFGTIGDASTSEGLFWETMNAAGVLQVPLLMSVWDDGYGISVPIEHQTTKASISEALAGMMTTPQKAGLDIYVVRGWDYLALCDTYQRAAYKVRMEHTPALVHVIEVTQPQGHSTSGSHERYKTPERLRWEGEYDCLAQLRTLVLGNGIASEAELAELEAQEKADVNAARRAAWDAFMGGVKDEIDELVPILDRLAAEAQSPEVLQAKEDLLKTLDPIRRDLYTATRKAMLATARHGHSESRANLVAWRVRSDVVNHDRYSSHLHSESAQSALRVPAVAATYDADAKLVDGREILQACFDSLLGRDPRVLAFGEDLGRLGDVNQAFAGLQEKYGVARVFDVGIREATILGQGIGMAMRGLRPIAEIQYLDYLLYALQIISDDLATLQYRTKGGQKAPVIIRTRGHRLEGIWHSGSPMGTIINAFRGVHVLVPRNMTQAAGFYNTLMLADEPALVIEVLNGYRLKERMPSNLAQFTLPLGVPEVLREGTDLTVVTYGPNCRLAIEAAELIEASFGLSIEVIDVQSLLPFDVSHRIAESVRKTNRVLFLDEDVPSGATAFMMQQVLEVQRAWRWLDAAPRSLAAKAHRPAYGSDGDYFSKPNLEQLLETIVEMLHEAEPDRAPLFHRA